MRKIDFLYLDNDSDITEMHLLHLDASECNCTRMHFSQLTEMHPVIFFHPDAFFGPLACTTADAFQSID